MQAVLFLCIMHSEDICIHIGQTAVAYKLYDTDCEEKLNFVNWYFLGLYAVEIKPLFIVFSGRT
jgi:hypothetical protein